MFSKKVGITVRLVVSVLLVVLALGVGLLFGYQYILNQDVRMKNYSAQISFASELENAKGTTIATETDENGEVTGITEALPTMDIPRENNVLIDEDTPGAVMLNIARGDNTNTIAKKLKEKGLIENTTFFTIFSKFNGFDSSYQYGTHYLTRGMRYDQIMFVLSQNPATKRITFVDGMTYKDVKNTLKKEGVNFDETKLDALMNSANGLTGYDVLSSIPAFKPNSDQTKIKQRDVLLEGYLFPDTYYFDVNAPEEDIVRTFIRNTDAKIYDEMYKRADEIGLTMDEVFILASIIQKESGIPEDQAKVSRVFHNRLQSGMALQSDATINYIREREGLSAEYYMNADDIAVDDPYNTYKNEGLPPGPICSPGMDAIWAALYPDTSNMNLYYFVAKGDGSGENAFAETAEGHEANVAQYMRR